jgi:hypothetical protein
MRGWLPGVNAPLRERLEAQYIPEPNSGCWLWVSFTHRGGHGTIYDASKGRKVFAHRASWELHRGTIPPGMCVLHKCDTASCVNPDHLYVGDQQQNVRDREERSRGARPKGVKNGNARLTEADVLAIRADPRKQVEIAVTYGIPQTHVSNIKRRQNWGHI